LSRAASRTISIGIACTCTWAIGCLHCRPPGRLTLGAYRSARDRHRVAAAGFYDAGTFRRGRDRHHPHRWRGISPLADALEPRNPLAPQTLTLGQTWTL
jgi:hypothetical protein